MAAEPSAPDPTYLYKILSAPPPDPMPKTLPPTALDEKDGFIHLSAAFQVPITANVFFSHCEQLWILKLRRDKLDGSLQYELSNGIAYPHLYDSAKGLGSGCVEDTIVLSKGKDQAWHAVEGMTSLEG